MSVENENLKASTFSNNELTLILGLKDKAEIVASNIITSPCVVIAGGCFASFMNKEVVKDIDIFILDVDDSVKMSILTLLKSKFDDLEDTTADYLRDNTNIKQIVMSRKMKYQFIFTKYKNREELIRHFDYTHCMVSYQSGKLYITRKTFDAIKNKHLIVNNKNQVAEWRRNKFLARGYTEPDSNTPMSINAFNSMIHQPANPAHWQPFARTNPMRGSPNPYVDAVTQSRIDKIIEDLEKDGR